MLALNARRTGHMRDIVATIQAEQDRIIRAPMAGLLVVQGTLNEGVSLEEADAAVEAVVADFINQTVVEEELAKVKNQAEATLAFSEVELLNRAMNLAFAANAGDPELVNQEAAGIQAVTPDTVQAMARQVLRRENCSTLYYRRQSDGSAVRWVGS